MASLIQLLQTPPDNNAGQQWFAGLAAIFFGLTGRFLPIFLFLRLLLSQEVRTVNSVPAAFDWSLAGLPGLWLEPAVHRTRRLPAGYPG